MRLRAPAKLNLGLRLGPLREDGLHELCSLFCPLSLSDSLVVEQASADRDEVLCPGVEGPNLAERAIELAREAGWSHGPVRVEIAKRIPVAAGLGGGSADAAAVLRFVRRTGGVPGGDQGLQEIAAGLGADVPSQIEPALSLVTGAGEVVRPLGDPAAFGVVLVPFADGLSTAEVYAQADRMGIGSSADELADLARTLAERAGDGFHPLSQPELLRNDLQEAALALRPEIAEALSALAAAGAEQVMVTGSGPTAVGICQDLPAADRVAAGLSSRFARASVAAAERGGADD